MTSLQQPFNSGHTVVALKKPDLLQAVGTRHCSASASPTATADQAQHSARLAGPGPDRLGPVVSVHHGRAGGRKMEPGPPDSAHPSSQWPAESAAARGTAGAPVGRPAADAPPARSTTPGQGGGEGFDSPRRHRGYSSPAAARCGPAPRSLRAAAAGEGRARRAWAGPRPITGRDEHGV